MVLCLETLFQKFMAVGIIVSAIKISTLMCCLLISLVFGFIMDQTPVCMISVFGIMTGMYWAHGKNLVMLQQFPNHSMAIMFQMVQLCLCHIMLLKGIL